MGMKITIKDDGTGLATVEWLDTAKNQIPAPAGSTTLVTSADANVLVSPTADGNPLTFDVKPAGPLTAGAVLNCTGTLSDGTTSFTDSGSVDVVSDPDSPGGVSLQLTAN
jgi:hypothetical protein